MFHQQGEVPRLVAVQGEISEDGSEPVYRHPSDQTLPTMRFSPTVQNIREHVQKALQHPVNHVLIQLYRSGADHISEHSDKSLDIVHGSNVANVSFGARRTMRLRLKKSALTSEQLELYEQDPASSRQTQRVIMPHNSLFVLGPKTNTRWLHGINPDKRPSSTRAAAETAYNGIRISLTFRHIGTFISPGPDAGQQRIWGQGAISKEKESAKAPISNNHVESEKLVHSFGKDNHDSDSFDWEKIYGSGSDVLHLREPPDETPILFLSGDRVQDLRVKMWLEELGLPHAVIEAPPQMEFSSLGKRQLRRVAFRDADRKHTEVEGALDVLAYLGTAAEEDGNAITKSDAAQRQREKSGIALQASFLYETMDINTLWNHFLHTELFSSDDPNATPHPLYCALTHRESSLSSNGFLAGPTFSIADCAVWPVVREMRHAMAKSRRTDLRAQEFDQEFPRLWAWFGRVEGRGATKRAMR